MDLDGFQWREVAVLVHLAAGRLRPVIDTELPFEQAPEAFRRLEAPDLFGKVVVSLPV